MRPGRGGIGECDLQAYGDGLLDKDPIRKRQVEEWLRSHPVEARRLWDYKAQNAALIERYGSVTEEPVPRRLYDALEARRSSWRPARAAVLAAMILASGVIGWRIGVESVPAPSPGLRFAALLADGGHTRVMPAERAQVRQLAGSALRIQPLGWLSEQVTIPLRLPDLSPFGYTPVERRLVGPHPGEAIEVTYAGRDRKPIVLLIAPRWQEDSSELELAALEGLRIAYGFKGPLRYGVAGDLDEQEIRKLAEAVRHDWDRRIATGTAGIGIKEGPVSVKPIQPIAAHPQALEGDGAM